MSEENKKKLFAQWLEKIQQESWQLELIISGFALYGIQEALKYLNKVSLLTNFETGDFSIIQILVLNSSKIVLKILFLCLLVHVALRCLWIGAIGLRYVSGEINFNVLKYSKVFTKYLKKNIKSFDEYISKLENWCSILFAYSFLLAFIFSSFVLYFLWSLLIMIITDRYSPEGNLGAFFIVPYFIIGIVYFFDFITLGSLKKIRLKFLAFPYLLIYRFLSLITLSFVYRPILYNFLDTKFTKRLFILIVPILLFISVLPQFENRGFRHEWYIQDEDRLVRGLYDDLSLENEIRAIYPLRSKSRIKWFRLKEHIVKSNFTSIFFTLHMEDSDYLEEIKSYKSEWKSGYRFKHNFMFKREANATRIIKSNEEGGQSGGRRDLELKDLVDLFTIEIDSINYDDSLSCKLYYHPNLKEEGIQCYIPMKSIQDGEHRMRIERKSYTSVSKDTFNVKKWDIPFWKYSED